MEVQAAGWRTPAAGPGRALVPEGLRLVAFVCATWIATDIGFASYRPEFGVSLIWPLSGVGLLWAATGDRRTWPLDAVLLTAVSSAALVVAGSTTGQAAMGALQVVLQATVYQAVMVRWAPALWGSGGTRPLRRTADLWVFLLAVTVGSAVASGVRAAGLGLVPTSDLQDASLVLARNLSWMIAVGGVALQLGPRLAPGGPRPARTRPEPGPRAAPTDRTWRGGPLELLALAVVTLAVYGAVFTREQPLPLTFLLTVPSLWAAMRLDALRAAVHAVASGTFAIVMTLSGNGVFASMDDPRVGAALAQALLAVLVLKTLVISCVMSERDAAIRRARVSEAASLGRAALLGAVLHNMNEGIVVAREDGEVLVRNAAGDALLRSSVMLTTLPDATRGRLFHPDGTALDEAELPFRRALAGEEVLREDLVLRSDSSPDGRVIEVSASPVAETEESPRAAVVNFRDVTTVREHEGDLAAFAGVVAHDLNNPLTVVSGWADSLADFFALGDVSAEDGQAMIGRIQGAATHMRRFIDDLLGYTVARDRPLSPEDLDLSAVAEEVARLRRDGATHPHIEIEPGIRVRADVVLLRQLLDNLVGNAVKYVAPHTRPHVTLTCRPAGDMVELRLTDNGIGIPESMRQRVFETFVRVQTDGYGGTGLGLDICRRVVVRHGGDIRVEEGAEGVGSTFVFTLPRAGARLPGLPPVERQQVAVSPEPTA
ncbi:ATP-binding protein [Nocardioides aurantiacus]|uniref:histidine kinase n=1 Tax=Nocardioides aurantiacus TaxID=86796 RepID=A0A3N2CQU3_9ACTN|nr:ATP-binding protein [Nocardioides aurantiacus]ROR89905.1 signal transduction histidine kinase [Nocardioides aurantiacus]